MRSTKAWHTLVVRDVAIFIAALSITGCGDDGGIALEAAPAAYASAYCERAFACCEATELQAMLGSGVVDRPSCETTLSRVFGNEFVDDTQRAIAQGRARYDADALATCLEHLRGDDCVHSVRVLRLMTFPTECASVRIARVEIGGACDHDFQCVSGACSGGADHASGQCVEVPGLGAACDGDCGPSAYCDRSGATPVCAAIAAVGAPCTTSLGCESLNCVMGVCAAPATCDGQ